MKKTEITESLDSIDDYAGLIQRRVADLQEDFDQIGARGQIEGVIEDCAYIIEIAESLLEAKHGKKP